jgi:hypothetical protein
MSALIAEGDGTTLVGTDAALPHAKPVVEVVLDGVKSQESKPLVTGERQSLRLATAMERRGVTVAKPAAATAPAAAAPPTGDADGTAAEVVLDGEPAGDDDGEAAAADGDQPDGEETTADGQPPPDAEAKPDPVELATLKAERDQTAAELALARARMAQLEGAVASEDEQRAYIDDPVSSLRGDIARRLGVKPDHKEVDRELAYLQRELTIAQLGDESLPDDRKSQRTSERWERSERLKQTVRTASQETTQQRAQHEQVVGFVASTYEAAKAEFPHLALAAELGRNPAEDALVLWTAAVKAGRTQPRGDVEDVKEALRLTNDFYKAKASRLSRHLTAPAPATAPEKASTQEAAPGAPKQTTSTAPAKAGSAPPKTLSAKQAAAAPAAKGAPAPQPNQPVVVDPRDRDAHRARVRAIAERHLKTK